VSVLHVHCTGDLQLPLESGSFLLEFDLGDSVPEGYWAKLDEGLNSLPPLPEEPEDPDPEPFV
jgi:hypothetical protein